MSEKSIQDIFRLAKPKRKGILALIFSRFLLIAALLVLQLAVFGVFFVWLYSYLPHFILFERLFAITMMIYLFSNSMDYSAKTTWMFIMVLVPVAGSAFLLFTQANTGQRAIKRRVEHTIEETRHALPQDPAVRKALLADGGDVDDLVSYLNRSGCFPAFDGTGVGNPEFGVRNLELD